MREVKFDNLDSMLPENLLLILYHETRDSKYKLAADRIKQRFDTYLRTKDGGFWHASSKSREWQLWGDGVFMSLPLLVRYGRMFGDSKYTNDEAVHQLLPYASHLNDPRTGLMFHAYDESGQSTWADTETRHSPEIWRRAMGWFGMTLIEVLELLPRDHPMRPLLIRKSYYSFELGPGIRTICEGTNVADLAYYFARKRNTNDFHGLGAFLIMNEKFMNKTLKGSKSL